MRFRRSGGSSVAHYLTDRDASGLMSILSCRHAVDLGEGVGRLLTGPLPGKAVCAIQEVDGLLYFIVDLEKPLAHRHARQMIREWRAGFAATVVVGDEPIDLVPVTPEPEGVCSFSYVS
jgi:hypothetical protein